MNRTPPCAWVAVQRITPKLKNYLDYAKLMEGKYAELVNTYNDMKWPQNRFLSSPILPYVCRAKDLLVLCDNAFEAKVYVSSDDLQFVLNLSCSAIDKQMAHIQWLITEAERAPTDPKPPSRKIHFRDIFKRGRF